MIIDDKLGLNAHLEEEMARLREAVVCEWTETVNTPSAQTRFKHFINSDKRDHERTDGARARTAPSGNAV